LKVHSKKQFSTLLSKKSQKRVSIRAKYSRLKGFGKEDVWFDRESKDLSTLFDLHPLFSEKSILEENVFNKF